MARARGTAQVMRGALVLGGLAVLAVGVWLTRPPDLALHSQRLELEVGRQLSRAGVRASRLVQEAKTLARVRGRSYQFIEKTYQCPSRFSPEAFVRDLVQALGPMGFELLRSERRAAPEGQLTILDLGYHRYRLYRLTLREPTAERGGAPAATAVIPALPKGRGKVAIVLDDWGYSRRLVPDVLRLNRPVTFAVLPHQPHSKTIAAAVQGSPCEVILHLPMEPDGRAPREPRVLVPGVSAAEIQRMLDDALATVPHARGLSNHQGSKATKDTALMRAFLRDVQRRGLFFLDSFVTEQSVGRHIARELGLPFAQRTVFLDNVETPAAIRQQILELAEVALRTGTAVGIGHDKAVTIEALREMMPQLEQQGIEFVRLSELATIP